MDNDGLLLTYDLVADVAYIYLRHPLARREIARADVAPVETPERSSIMLNFDDYDRLVGIEILGASKLLPPELL